MDDWLEIGKILAAQGLQGEVRVYPASDFPERFLKPGRRWLLRLGATQPEPIDLISGRYLDGKGLYVLKFKGIGDRTQAEGLRDCLLLVPERDRPTLEPDEFHVVDLIGLAVFDQATQALIGTITSVIAAGNDLLEVKRAITSPDHPPDHPPEKSNPVLIPFVKAIVPVVDLKNRRIEITPPDGLV